MQTSKSDNVLIALWLLGSVVAVLPALNLLSAALVNGEYIPVGNDSFYHARRIIDAATSERGFYQFDDMIHAPEGSWLTWPWAYDFFMAQALKLKLWMDPGTEPMAFLAYIPVFFIFVNTALFILVARALSLSITLTGVALIGFALSPLNQLLHGVGLIDHHFLELTFVLFSTWSGLRFFADPTSRSAAIQLGVSLGLASAAHNSLFILQLPVMAAALLLWLRGKHEVFAEAEAFAAALVASTLLIVIPSQPFQQFFFEFTTLSWFHLYISACSGAGFILLKRAPMSSKGQLIVAGAAVLLALPLLAPVIVGANYVAGEQIGLPEVTEAVGPFRQMLDAGTHLASTHYYGFLLFAVPLVLVYFAWLAFRGRSAPETFFGLSGAFGLVLLLAQFRFHPFGYWALLLGLVYAGQRLTEARDLKPSTVAAAAAALLLVSMQPALQHGLFKKFMPSLTTEYAVIHPIFDEFAAACEELPGIALVSPDNGHPTRYHTDCSVIANNFLLTPQHGEKLVYARQLMALSPDELLQRAPEVRYVLVHIHEIYRRSENGPVATPLDELRAVNARLMYELAVEGNVPERYELISELRVEDERDIAYAQVYRILP